MPERRLLIDLGNSRLKWAWATAGELDTASAGKGGLKELEQACRDFGPQPPDEILLSSVAGDGGMRR
jgi:pantothenate kinase type III